MKIEVHHYIHCCESDKSKLNSIETKINLLIKNQKTEMTKLSDIQAKNDALVAAVAAEDTVIDSAVVLIEGNQATLVDLKQQLADAIANGGTPEALQALSDSMDATIADTAAKKDALAAAVAAGTPAA